MNIIIRKLFLPYLAWHAKRYRKKFPNQLVDFAFCKEPLINFHPMIELLKTMGFTAESVVTYPYYITNDFDNIFFNDYIQMRNGEFKKKIIFFKINFFYNFLNNIIDKILKRFYLDIYYNLCIFSFVVHKYKIIFHSFSGFFSSYDAISNQDTVKFLRKLKIKIVILGYGADFQDYTNNNLWQLKVAYSMSYPNFRRSSQEINNNLYLYASHADYILAGGDMIAHVNGFDDYYLNYCFRNLESTLQIANQQDDFIDEYLTKYKPDSFKVFHGPNHIHIKGTKFLVKAIEELNAEGYNIEMCFIQGVSNDKILKLMNKCDIVVDQFIMGYYGMTAIEGMAVKKPVMCYINNKSVESVTIAGNLELNEELPFINTNIYQIKEKLKYYYNNRKELEILGKKSFEYVTKYHSLEHGKKVFEKILTHFNLLKK